MAFNPLSDFLSGQQAGEQEKAKGLMDTLSGSQSPMLEPEFDQLLKLAPERAKNIMDAYKVKDQDRMNAQIKDAKTTAYLLQTNPQAVAPFLKNRLDIGMADSEMGDTMALYEKALANDLPGVANDVGAFLSLFDAGFKNGGKSAETQTFDDLVRQAGLTKAEAAQAAKIKLRLIPGAVGSASQTIADDPDKLLAVSAAEAKIAGTVEQSKLIARMELEPQLQGMLNDAVAQSAQMAKVSTENRSNQRAYDVYKVGITGLENALAGTSTGTFVGLIPAFTTGGKVADGAIAIMRPIIKDAVRSAGEGTFTDSDQKLINDMLPTRTDTPEAISMKLQMLDNFMGIKLQITPTQQPDAADLSTLTLEQLKELRARGGQ